MTNLDKPVDEILQKIRSYENLRADLGNEFVDAKISELKALLPPTPGPSVDTGGGANITGNIATQGGDLVGRDYIQAVLGVRNVNIGQDSTGNIIVTGDGNQIIIDPNQADTDLLLLAYYQHLSNECRRLPLGVIDTNFVSTQNNQPVPLPDIYVDLDVISAPVKDIRDEKSWALKLERGEAKDQTGLFETVTQAEAHRIVLLGNAGTGKTTFVNYLTYLLAKADPALPDTLAGLLPIRLILRQVAAHHIPVDCDQGQAEFLWDALLADIRQRLGPAAAQKLVLHIQQHLILHGGLILLDGLDEVPEAHQRRQALIEAIQCLVDLLPQARFIITARPYAYADRDWHIENCDVLALAPFRDEQVASFIQRWYQAVRPAMNWDAGTAKVKGESLQQALKERTYLADLASRPLLLTLMATLHSSWGQLPQDRAELYEGTVRLLLTKWQRAREVKDPLTGQPVLESSITQVLGVGEEALREALERLAFTIHNRQRTDPENQDSAADISEGELLVAFKPILGTVSPADLFDYLQNRAGLLIPRLNDLYAFPHRSFQEYLAACYLTRQGLVSAMQHFLVDDASWWREVFLLGVGKVNQGGLGQAIDVISALLPAPEDIDTIQAYHWEIAAIAGQALLELRLPEKITLDPVSPHKPILKRTRRWLTCYVEDGHSTPRDRSAAGGILGQLGDPRFDPHNFYLSKTFRGQPETALGFVRIPAGKFMMGSKESDEEAYDREQPQHEVDLPYDYWMSRYPVTVAQFKIFVEDSGYQLRDGRSILENPNWPVCDVSWYEARAYCEWLTEQLSGVSSDRFVGRVLSPDEQAFGQRLATGKLLFRLPTEAEWEKAARCGDTRRYPWGDDDWNPERANIYDSGIGHPTPVGIYPQGATPTGLLDMSGNLFEWTQSLWGKSSSEPDYKYPYDRMDGRESLDAANNNSRVVRGGSWTDFRRFVRCASRFGFTPDFFGNSLGFRVVSPG
jgi:formylglycine-generating enzyme required for sulfatase activity